MYCRLLEISSVHLKIILAVLFIYFSYILYLYCLFSLFHIVIHAKLAMPTVLVQFLKNSQKIEFKKVGVSPPNLGTKIFANFCYFTGKIWDKLLIFPKFRFKNST